MTQKMLNDAIEYARTFIHEGEVASYIPELAKGNKDHLGGCIMTVDGACFHVGDWQQTFTMQSISKTISLILALQTAGTEKVFSRVGVEPTGDAFNSMLKLELKDGKPLNPMINAGAIATVSCIPGEDPFGQFMALTRRLCRRDSIEMDEAVYLSEKATGMRNRSMAYFMQSEGVFGADEVVEDILDIYFKMCSVSVNTEDLANYGMIMANGGVDPFTGEKLVEDWILRIVKTLMMTCGLYDGSGRFAIRVGIPTKSGVGGGMLSVVDGRMGISIFSPALDDKGNSVGGYRALEYLSNALNLHYFSQENYKSKVVKGTEKIIKEMHF